MRFPHVAALVALLVAVTGWGTAYGQVDPSSDVRIREIHVGDDGTTQLLVSVGGDLVGDEAFTADDFRVSENGQRVPSLEVQPLFDSEASVDIVVGLVFDLSGSMQGGPLVAAQDAAKRFVAAATERDVKVLLVTFADEAELILPPTSDAAALTAAIDSFEASGETAFFDGVVLAARQLAELDVQRNILAFTDGADTASGSELPDAVDAALGAQAPVNTIFLEGAEFDTEAVQRLSEATGGAVLGAGSAAELASAFDEVVARLASQYVVTYQAPYEDIEELSISVRVDTEAVSGSDTIVALNTRIPPTPEARTIPIEPPGFLGEPLVRHIGVYAAGGALVLILGLLLVGPFNRRAGRRLQRSLEVHARGQSADTVGGVGLSASAIGRRAVELVDQLPKPEGSAERLQLQLDRATWPLRSSEFLLVTFGAGVGGLVLGWALTGNLLAGVLFMFVAGAVPYLLLINKIARRQAAFAEQLPDTLQLMAGALKAGYGLLQAIDTVEKESGDPIASEFRRVLTEARLGLSIEDSLDAMAERLGSEDFKWVVVAINIQRTVGGNLAELLETVAHTLRQREQVRRQIKALSAEGRLSGIILVALPFFLVGYMLVVSPGYLLPLFTNPVGQMMILVGLLLMGAGIFWIRNLVKIEV